MTLEKFKSPGEHVCTFETDELTALCPFDFGGPDYYNIQIKYKPDEYVIESRSLKKYLESFRQREISAEKLAVTIHSDIEECIEPEWIHITLEQSRRGGIEETVEVGKNG